MKLTQQWGDIRKVLKVFASFSPLINFALGPDKQGHAVQPLHVARRHMPGALVIPLLVLLEHISLHLPQGVGQSAAWGGWSKRSTRVSGKGVQGRWELR